MNHTDVVTSGRISPAVAGVWMPGREGRRWNGKRERGSEKGRGEERNLREKGRKD